MGRKNDKKFPDTKPTRKRRATLETRISLYDRRHEFARQTAGGEKLVPMMNKPGSQNRKK